MSGLLQSFNQHTPMSTPLAWFALLSGVFLGLDQSVSLLRSTWACMGSVQVRRLWRLEDEWVGVTLKSTKPHVYALGMVCPSAQCFPGDWTSLYPFYAALGAAWVQCK